MILKQIGRQERKASTRRVISSALLALALLALVALSWYPMMSDPADIAAWYPMM